MELASMPKLEYLWVPGLSTEEENFFKFRFPHLKINDGFLTSIALPDQSFKRQHGLWEKNVHNLISFHQNIGIQNFHDNHSIVIG